jgi:hypothetical protein
MMSSSDWKPTNVKAVGRAYVIKYDHKEKIEYRVFPDGRKEVIQSTNGVSTDAPSENMDWDAFAYKIARAYDGKVKNLMERNWKDWRVVRRLNFRWWRVWKLWSYFKLKREIAGYKDKMSRDELRFAEIDRVTTLAV